MESSDSAESENLNVCCFVFLYIFWKLSNLFLSSSNKLGIFSASGSSPPASTACHLRPGWLLTISTIDHIRPKTMRLEPDGVVSTPSSPCIDGCVVRAPVSKAHRRGSQLRTPSVNTPRGPLPDQAPPNIPNTGPGPSQSNKPK